MATRESGLLRKVEKTTRARKYTSWQWRTKHQGDLGWKEVDLELGPTLWNMRTRLYVALGELKAKTLVERYVRWHLRRMHELKAYTGDPGHGAAAWWVSFPQPGCDRVKLRLRSGTSWLDFRQQCWRDWFHHIESEATDLWNHLALDPIIELARLQWQEGQAQEQVDQINNEKLPALRKAKRDGTLDKRDFEADERDCYRRLDGWENVSSSSAASWDEKLQAMVDALPRARRQQLKPRIVAMADRYFNDPRQKNAWVNEQWEDHTMTWHC